MAFAMTALTRLPSGAYAARKGIPKDVQEEYARLYGVRWEAKCTWPASLKPQVAKTKYGEWIAEIETRISAIRAGQRGQRQSLSQKQAHALAGAWYRWFIGPHEDNPGTPEQWDKQFWALIDRMEEFAPESILSANYKTTDQIQAPEVRDGIRPTIAKEAKVDQFLASRGIALTEEAYSRFVDCVLDDYIAVVGVLERRARGDYSRDKRLEQFPEYETAPKPHKDHKGLTPLKLFEAWVDARTPAQSTVDRWRSVFIELERHFEGRTAASITTEEAQEWAEGAINKKRSADTVKEVWCNAAHTVYRWAVKTRKLNSNPFDGVTVTTSRKVRKREKEFNEKEISLILGASLAFSNITENTFDAARRWVPWLCAYTGARAGEITQLRGQDVFKRDGNWVIQITPGEDPTGPRCPAT
jgi:hypothetical protein